MRDRAMMRNLPNVENTPHHADLDSPQFSPIAPSPAVSCAVALGAMRYKNLASMLKTGLDRAPLPASAPQQAELALPDAHANLRGAHYYH